MLIGHLTRNILRGDPSNHLPLFRLKAAASCYYSSRATQQQQPDSVAILRPADSRLSSSSALKIKTISQAMKAYLERAKKHEDFLKVKNEEFETGKLHLANMMGLCSCLSLSFSTLFTTEHILRNFHGATIPLV